MRFTANLREPEKLSASFKALTLPLSGGYEEGYTDGHSAGYTEGEAAGYNKGRAEGAEQGRQTENDRFWDDYQYNGERTNYEYAFRAVYGSAVNGAGGFTPNIFFPKYDIIATGSANFMFANFAQHNGGFDIVDRLTECGVTIDLSGATTLNQTFVNCGTKRLPALDIAKSGNNTQTFGNCSFLVSIEKLTVSEKQTFNNTFYGCNELVGITIEGFIGKAISFASSSKLSNGSIQSIIDALSDLTGQTAQTLTLHATVGGKLTEEQKEIIAAKNWTLVY